MFPNREFLLKSPTIIKQEDHVLDQGMADLTFLTCKINTALIKEVTVLCRKLIFFPTPSNY